MKLRLARFNEDLVNELDGRDFLVAGVALFFIVLVKVGDKIGNVGVGTSVGVHRVLHDDLLQVVDSFRPEMVQDARQHFGNLQKMSSRSDLTNQ